MSDLSNLLGDLYGDSRNPDGPPVRHEPAATERDEWTPVRSDDDLAAALSAALADAPAAPVMPAVAPVAEPVAPIADYSQPMPAPAPVAPVMPAVAAAPIAPVAPVAAPAPARGAWTAAPADYEVAAPVAVAAPVMPAGPRMWARGDDDIFAMSGAAKKRK